MGEQNWGNRTLFHGDNFDFLRGMNSDTVDLIATDPPFNKKPRFPCDAGFFGCWCLISGSLVLGERCA